MRELCLFVYAHTREFDGSHDVQHMRSVVDNVHAIVSRMSVEDAGGFDPEHVRFLAEAVAWMHDVCDAKYKECSKIDSAQMLNFLVCMFEPHVACMVHDVAASISYSRLRRCGAPPLPSLDAVVWQVVSEADMLEAMGATGIMRTLMYQGAVHKSLADALAYADEHLTLCIRYMRHARAEANVRLRRMRWIVDAATRAGAIDHREAAAFAEACHACGRRRLAGLRGTAPAWDGTARRPG